MYFGQSQASYFQLFFRFYDTGTCISSAGCWQLCWDSSLCVWSDMTSRPPGSHTPPAHAQYLPTHKDRRGVLYSKCIHVSPHMHLSFTVLRSTGLAYNGLQCSNAEHMNYFYWQNVLLCSHVGAFTCSLALHMYNKNPLLQWCCFRSV